MIRNPAVAGYFYPAEADELKSMLNSLVVKDKSKEDTLGVISPHAGYIYSGKVAGKLFSRINIPDEVIILSPNHTGWGVPFSLWPSGQWETPLGRVNISESLNNMLKSSYELIEEDTDAHLREHAAEVIIPFLQFLNPNVQISVMVLAPHMASEGKKDLGLALLKDFGTALAEKLKTYSNKVLIVASSDMNHHEPQEVGESKDAKAIAKIKELDEEGLYSEIRKYNITMCGYAPAIAMISACKRMGAKKAELVMYSTSAEASSDYSSVVGYASFMIKSTEAALLNKFL